MTAFLTVQQAAERLQVPDVPQRLDAPEARGRDEAVARAEAAEAALARMRPVVDAAGAYNDQMPARVAARTILALLDGDGEGGE